MPPLAIGRNRRPSSQVNPIFRNSPTSGGVMPPAFDPTSVGGIGAPAANPTAPTPAPATPSPMPTPAAPAAPAHPAWWQEANATGPYASTINQYTNAQNRSNQANDDRYNATLSTLEGQGQTAKNDIARSGQNERGDITQDAIGRGIYSTSVLDSMRGESVGREQRASAGVDESVAAQRAGVMERRTDQGPDAGFYSNLINQQAAGAAGSQRSFNTVGASSGGGGPTFGQGGGSGGGGGGGSSSDENMSRGATFGRSGGGGGGGSSGVPFGQSYGNNPGSSYSGVQGFARDGSYTNPDGTARIDTHYNPAGGSNIYLGEHLGPNGEISSVTQGNDPNAAGGGRGAGGTPNNDVTSEDYWIAQGRTRVEAREMASRMWNQTHPGQTR